MQDYKLTKKVVLYRNQFEEFATGIFNEHRLERKSVELDGLSFRIKYMIKHHKDLDKINEMKQKFIQLSLEMRETFGKIVYEYLTQNVGAKEEFIRDLMILDVKMDMTYVKFTMAVISDDELFLQRIDEVIPDGKPDNLFPCKYFRFYTDSYNDAIAKAYPELFKNRQQNEVGTGRDSDVFVHSFTFQTSERCSLNCTYCYQFNKSPMRMSFETAKKFIDDLLDDKYGYINRYNSPAIIIEFIGGEPLLEIDVTRKIYEYFLERCYEMDHPWFTLHRLSICSNGLQYFDKPVQNFFKDYAHNISFNISIDGNKELHDSCRVQPNGEGSYDIAMMALNHYNKYYASERNSKMTLAPNNIKYLYESVVDFIEHDMTSINLNCVFEEGWNIQTARVEYEQLIKLADYLIDTDKSNIYVSIFNERQEERYERSFDGNWCGGTGSMLALRPNGQFYPCIRYMPTSVGDNVKDLCIGTVDGGLIGRGNDSDVLKLLDGITRRSQCNDICYDCPIGSDCPGCSALGHTVFGTPNKKCTFICIQMIAEALANVYYWNQLLILHPEYELPVRKNNVPDEWALKILSQKELDDLKWLEVCAMMKKIENS